MSDARFTIDVEGNVFKALDGIRKDTNKLKKGVTGIEKSSKKAFSGMQKHIKNISFVNMTQGLENATQALADIAGPGIKFESSMAELSAITGLTGEKLDNLGTKARENAKIFGGDAAKSVDTFKLLLSQLGPVLAESPETLDIMAKNAEKLAKTMGGDVVGATEVLTTAMNQYNVDLSDASHANEVMSSMMNSMAASAKEGSSELPTLQAAVKNVGGDAMRANVSFEEMLSSIQLLDKAGKKGAEGGIALRNVISTLNKGRFLPPDVQEELQKAGVNIEALSDKSLSFTDRLRQLEGASSDAALMSKLFGRESAGAAQALLQSIDAQEDLTTAITGTTVAEEQAAIMMKTAEEKQARLKAQIADFKVTLFNATGGVFAYLQPISDVARQLSAFVPITSAAASGISALRKSKLAGAIVTKAVTAAQWLWNAAMAANPIIAITAGVVALGVGIYALSGAFSSSTPQQEAANRVHEKSIELVAEEMGEISLLTTKIKNSKTMRKDAIDELIAKYPSLLDKYKDEEAILKNIDKIQEDLKKNAMERAEEQARAEIMKLNSIKIAKLKMEDPTFWEETKAAWSGWDAFWGDEDAINAGVMASRDETINGLLQQNQELMSQNDKTVAPKSTAGSSLFNNDEPAMPYIDSKKSGGNYLMQGVTSPSSPEGGEGGEGGDSPTVKNREKVIQGAGGEMKNINVSIENLVKNITLSTTNMQQGTGKIKEEVTKAMVAAVRDFEVAM